MLLFNRNICKINRESKSRLQKEEGGGVRVASALLKHVTDCYAAIDKD